MEPTGRMFQCKICRKKHASLIHLERHWGVHFRDILCEQCDFAFSTSENLDRHVRAVHDEIKDLPPLMYVGDLHLPKEGSVPAKDFKDCAIVPQISK